MALRTLAVGALSLAMAMAQSPPPPCSLNGEMQGGKCVCDRPWTGPECSTLQFKPIAVPQG